jgi:hypothetical protein
LVNTAGPFFIRSLFQLFQGSLAGFGAGVITYWLIKKKFLVITFVVSILAVLSAFVWLNSNENYLKLAPNYNKTIFHSDFKQHIWQRIN